MKRLCTLLLLFGLLALNPGCTTLAPGADPVVVRAEQVQAISLEAVDTFLRWEYGAKPGGDAHKVAERLRQEFPRALGTLSTLKYAYKTNRTPQGKADLITAISVVAASAEQAKLYLGN
jgi:hypothetical protein